MPPNPFEMNRITAAKNSLQVALLPKQTIIGNSAAIWVGNDNDDTVQALAKGSKMPSTQTRFLFLFGKVNYDDTFGGPTHTAEYCMEAHTGEAHGSTDELYFTQCGAHNCADSECAVTTR